MGEYNVNIGQLIQLVKSICQSSNNLYNFFCAYKNWLVEDKEDGYLSYNTHIFCPNKMTDLETEHCKANEQNKNLYMHLPEDFSYKSLLSDQDLLEPFFIPLSTKAYIRPNIVFLSEEFLKNAYVIGDIHGDYFGLLAIVNRILVDEGNFIFLGDYIDRGQYSTQSLVLVLLLSIIYPERVVVLRGNHEVYNMCTQYGWLNELWRMYKSQNYPNAYNIILQGCEIFELLSIAAVSKKHEIFLVHGGPPLLGKFKDKKGKETENMLEKPFDYFQSRNIIQYLWGDFQNESGYAFNAERNIGWLFGSDCYHFIKVIRAHQIIEDKTKARSHDGKLITIFSNGDESNPCSAYSAKCLSPFIGHFTNQNNLELIDIYDKNAIIVSSIAATIVLLSASDIKFTADDKIEFTVNEEIILDYYNKRYNTILSQYTRWAENCDQEASKSLFNYELNNCIVTISEIPKDVLEFFKINLSESQFSADTLNDFVNKYKLQSRSQLLKTVLF